VSETINHGTVHICVDIRWLLEMSDRKLSSIMRDDNGKRRPAREVREFLYQSLQRGWDVLPFGEPCQGFDYKTGCPGHPAATTRGEG